MSHVDMRVVVQVLLGYLILYIAFGVWGVSVQTSLDGFIPSNWDGDLRGLWGLLNGLWTVYSGYTVVTLILDAIWD